MKPNYRCTRKERLASVQRTIVIRVLALPQNSTLVTMNANQCPVTTWQHTTARNLRKLFGHKFLENLENQFC
jgi:hypothetical protein